MLVGSLTSLALITSPMFKKEKMTAITSIGNWLNQSSSELIWKFLNALLDASRSEEAFLFIILKEEV